MYKQNRTLSGYFLVLMAVLLFSVPLSAQYIINQVEYYIEPQYEWLPEDIDIQTLSDELKLFSEISMEKLQELLETEADYFEVTTSTIYIDDEKIAVESETPDGRYTMIADTEKKIYYNVIWPEKQVMVFKESDLKDTQQQAEQAANDMMANLSPEMRAQIEEAEKMEKSAYNEYTVESTGKKMKKYGFDCEQFIIEKEEELITVWASGEMLDLTEKIETVSTRFEEVFQVEEEDEEVDEWDLLPGKIPVEVRTVRGGMMGSTEMEVYTITEIQEQSPPAEVFQVPDESQGFTHRSMKEMMEQMMNMMPDPEY